MHFLDLILKKRSGSSLTTDEIRFFIKSYVNGQIPDYQVSAFLMAIWFVGMDARETADLTFAMRDSGDVIDLSHFSGPIADKHSTGGVADTTTLITAPIVAACGVKIAKMSGRGLGHTGGTLDKLDSIPGFQTSISMERFKEIVSSCNLSVIGQTTSLVPADKLLYALRDVTGTVDNISLIASSIMSKKLASGADTIVLDVKAGNGSFLKDQVEAEKVAEAMVGIGKTAGKNIKALVTDMNQPLGNAIGNSIEVVEAIEILKGHHAGDLKTVSVALATNIIYAAGIVSDLEEAETQALSALESGKALNHLVSMIEAQGGNPEVCTDTTLLPTADKLIKVQAPASGYIAEITTDQLGMSALLLGAGRSKKSDTIDPAVGIWMKKRLGEYVEKGDDLAVFHVNDDKNLLQAQKRFIDGIIISAAQPEKKPLIYKTLQ